MVEVERTTVGLVVKGIDEQTKIAEAFKTKLESQYLHWIDQSPHPKTSR